jgi:hypothetical protein
MRVDLSQENEIKCERGHLQRDPMCPSCHHLVTIFNGFIGNGFTAIPPVLPDEPDGKPPTRVGTSSWNSR